jgi:hypothetical protein
MGFNYVPHPDEHFFIEGGTYRPDGYFPASGCYIEVKGGSINKHGNLEIRGTAQWRQKMKQIYERYPVTKLVIVVGRYSPKHFFITAKELTLKEFIENHCRRRK